MPNPEMKTSVLSPEASQSPDRSPVPVSSESSPAGTAPASVSSEASPAGAPAPSVFSDPSEKLNNLAGLSEIEQLKEVVRLLRAPGGCPWDREQTHESLKPEIIEEGCEVLCGINTLTATGDPENFKEELGDLLLQIVMHAEIAEEEGLFTFEDVCCGIKEKMIYRHPHVFGDVSVKDSEEVLANWEILKAEEKSGKAPETGLGAAFDEAQVLIEKARERKRAKGKL